METASSEEIRIRLRVGRSVRPSFDRSVGPSVCQNVLPSRNIRSFALSCAGDLSTRDTKSFKRYFNESAIKTHGERRCVHASETRLKKPVGSHKSYLSGRSLVLAPDYTAAFVCFCVLCSAFIPRKRIRQLPCTIRYTKTD